MECLWRLFSHRRQDGDCHQPDQAIFYLCITAYDGLSYYSLYGAGFLEKYPQIYIGGKKKSLVLPVSYKW